MLGGRHPAGSVECVADGCEGVAAVAAGGGEVGADAAVALQGRQGAPAAADFRGELVARTAFSDPLFVAGTSKRGEEPDPAGLAFQPPGQDQSGVVSPCARTGTG